MPLQCIYQYAVYGISLMLPCRFFSNDNKYIHSVCACVTRTVQRVTGLFLYKR